MDRQQFSQILNTRRKALGCTYVELTTKTGRHSQILQNTIMGRTNVFMETVLQITSQLKIEIALNNNYNTFVIDTPESLYLWAQKAFKESTKSQSEFAKDVGFHRNSLPSHLNGTSKMRIDTFLKWAEITGYTVDIQPK